MSEDDPRWRDHKHGQLQDRMRGYQPMNEKQPAGPDLVLKGVRDDALRRAIGKIS